MAAHAFGVVDGDPLDDRAAHRDAREVGALDPQVVQERERVGEQIVAGVARPPGG